MKKFWNWIRDETGGRELRLEGPIDNENFWGDEITPQDFRASICVMTAAWKCPAKTAETAIG